MNISSFENIIAWQKAKTLTLKIYSIFNNNRDYGLKDQIQRASVSIMNNIAEGFERSSDADFKRFLFIAKGSCGEVRSMLYLAAELKYISNDEFIHLKNQTIEISKAISGFIKYLK